MERCTASDEILVGSDSSSKKYKVSFADLLPTCTCVSFAIGRNKAKAKLDGKTINETGNKDAWCKHIDRVYNDACRWRGNTLIPGMCPECGGPTAALDAPVTAPTTPAPAPKKVVTSHMSEIEKSLNAWVNSE